MRGVGDMIVVILPYWIICVQEGEEHKATVPDAVPQKEPHGK